MLHVEQRNTPRSPEAGLSRNRDARGVPLTQPSAASATPGAIASMPTGAKGGRRLQDADEAGPTGLGGGHERSILKRGHHELAVYPSSRGQRAATSPWPEGGQRWGARVWQGTKNGRRKR